MYKTYLLVILLNPILAANGQDINLNQEVVSSRTTLSDPNGQLINIPGPNLKDVHYHPHPHNSILPYTLPSFSYGTGSKPNHLDRNLADIKIPDRMGLGGGANELFKGKVRIQFKQPFPDWLHDITGLNKWPDESPPYIPSDEIDLSNVPKIPKRSLGDCSNVERSHCSFECYRCVAPDDIITCPVMSQTFDDGPSPSTPKLLDQLPVKTTFFTQGINVIRFPETVRQQHQQGHLLASHTWSHLNLPGLSNEDIVAQIQWSIWAINATAGVVPRYFRPPYGAIDDRVRTITRQFGLVAVFWDKDTFDWRVNDRSKTENEVYQDVRQWQAESPGALILEHDSTIKTVNVGIEVSRLIHSKQMTVADCVNGPWYNN